MDRNDLIQYLNDLSLQYPIMKGWSIHPWKSMLGMVREGNLRAIQVIQDICRCLTSDGWQELANAAATYGRLDILEWIREDSPININWSIIAFIARRRGYSEIASYGDGYPYIMNDLPTEDYDPYPLNMGPEGDPTADKGKWVFDYRLENYKEDMIPEEALPIGEGEDDNPLATIPYPLGQSGWGFEGYDPKLEYYDDDDEPESLDVSPDDEI